MLAASTCRPSDRPVQCTRSGIVIEVALRIPEVASQVYPEFVDERDSLVLEQCSHHGGVPPSPTAGEVSMPVDHPVRYCGDVRWSMMEEPPDHPCRTTRASGAGDSPVRRHSTRWDLPDDREDALGEETVGACGGTATLPHRSTSVHRRAGFRRRSSQCPTRRGARVVHAREGAQPGPARRSPPVPW